MNLYPTTYEEALEQVTEVKEWTEVIEKHLLKKELNIEKFKVNYHWGFFVSRPDGVSRQEYYQDLYMRYEYMLFEERLEEELSKVRVNVVMEYGKLILSNRIKGVPSDIEKIVTEITKIKMLHEGKMHGNKDVIDSIPAVDAQIIGYDEIDMDGEHLEETYDVDEILDKIGREGIDSLTDGERAFLKSMSDDN